MNKSVKSPAEIAGDFSKRPELLLIAVIYNNPDEVSENLRAEGLLDSIYPADPLMGWFEKYGYQLNRKTFIKILSVPFNPNSGNTTDDYDEVIKAQLQISEGLNSIEIEETDLSWGAFSNELGNLYDTVFSSETAPAPAGEMVKRAVDEQAQSLATAEKKEKNKNWIVAGFGICMIIILVLLIVLISQTAKKT